MNNSVLEVDSARSSAGLPENNSTAVKSLPVDPVTLVLGLSLLLLLATWDKSFYLLGLGLMACALGFLRPQYLRSPRFWLTIAVCQAVRNLTAWMTLDDHIYVANYWTLAIAIALMSANPRAIMSHNARWLIALIFVFATGWKAISLEYTSGAFFEYSLLLDDRFLPLAEAGGLADQQLAENYKNMAAVRDPGNAMTAFTLNSSPRIQSFALILTWWTVIIEGLLAACFVLAPLAPFRAIRNPLLILFALTTYFPVPVAGFCSTLMVLGVAQTREEERRARIGYIVVFFLILIWTPIWRNFIYLG